MKQLPGPEPAPTQGRTAKLVLLFVLVGVACVVVAKRWDAIRARIGLGEPDYEPHLSETTAEVPLFPKSEQRSPNAPPELEQNPIIGGLFSKLKAKDYEGVEAELTALHERGRLEGSFRTHLDVAVSRLIQAPAAVKRFKPWLKARKGNFWPEYVMGEWLVEHAWDARGEGLASTVHEKGAALFTDRLRSAETHLRYAQELDPTSPYPGAALQTVAFALGLSESRREQYFQAAIQADPHYIWTYRSRLSGLKPKWGGSLRAALAFCERVVAQQPKEPALLILRIDLLQELTNPLLGGRSLSPEEVASIDRDYKILHKAYPRSGAVAYRRSHYYRLTKQPTKRAVWIRRAAEYGHSSGMRYFGLAYEYGRYGMSVDYAEAYRWARRAALEGGSVKACGDVARALYMGRGVKRDHPGAYAWFSRGANAGNNHCMLWLGLMQAKGEGTRPNLRAGFKWIKRASESGNAEAGKHVKELLDRYPELRGVE